jgi:hypothetical protein
MEVVMGEFYLGLFTGVVILCVAVPMIQWLSEREPRRGKSEPMRHIDEYV